MQRRINKIIELSELRDKTYDKVQIHQEKMKNTCDKKVKEDTLQIDYLVLKWDAPHEDKGKHGKFDHLWVAPYIIATHRGNNYFIIQYQDGSQYEGGPVSGIFLKHYLN